MAIFVYGVIFSWRRRPYVGYVLLLPLLSLYTKEVSAQQNNQLEDIIANQVLDESEASNELAEYSEALLDILKKPIDLNKASEQDLNQLIFLSAFRIQQILLHREKVGSFISPLELQVIPGLSLETLDQLLPFVIVKEPFLDQFSIPEVAKKAISTVMVTYGRSLQVPQGYKISDPKRSKYLGTPDKMSVRYRWTYQDRLRMTLNMEKDAGEPFFMEEKIYGFDHISGSLLFNKVGPFSKVIFGDYLLQFGQGLTIWNGAVFGKGASVAHVMQQGLGIRPHTGMMESKYMRGVAGTFLFKKINLTPFISYNRLTATVKEEGPHRNITSINYSGLHRTPSELRNRRGLGQTTYGLNADYQKRGFVIGTNFISTHFEIPLKLNSREYSKYRFEGHALQNISAYYRFNFYNLLFFGESAHSLGSGFANNHGVIAALGRKFSTSLSYRNYTVDYHSFFAQSFQDQSLLANEKGWHLSFVYHPRRRIEWMNSIDYIKFPWKKFRANQSTFTFQGRTQFSYIWYKKGHLKFRYQYKFFQENYPSAMKRKIGIADVARQQARVAFLYKLKPNFQIGNQVEFKRFEKTAVGRKNGFLIFQDVIWGYPKWKIGGNFRVAYFQADGYESRLYAYERNVLHSFSFPSYFRKGLRIYFNKKIKPVRGLDIWFRYALTHYLGISELGSGLDKIAGNQKSDVRLQLRYSW